MLSVHEMSLDIPETQAPNNLFFKYPLIFSLTSNIGITIEFVSHM